MSNPKQIRVTAESRSALELAAMTVPLVPAYGRDYQSADEVMEAWNNNLDFRIQCVAHPYDGKYINKADAEMFGPASRYYVRYNALQDVVWVQHSDPKLVGKSSREDD